MVLSVALPLVSAALLFEDMAVVLEWCSELG